MKRERSLAFRAWGMKNTDLVSDLMMSVENAAKAEVREAVAGVMMGFAKLAFTAGWDAAIDYCMQPVENEVPAGTAIPNEHTNNTCEPILSGREDEVNDC